MASAPTQIDVVAALREDPRPGPSREVLEFMERIKPQLRGEVGVQLVPEYEPCTLGFDTRWPDRLLCGRQVFEYLRARGIPEKRVS